MNTTNLYEKYEKWKEQSKKYREANKERLNTYGREKVICECGASITRSGKSRHLKSKIHNKIHNKTTQTLQDKIAELEKELLILKKLK